MLFATVVEAKPPRIISFGPAARYIGQHQTYYFTVYAAGSHALEYHWYHQEPDASEGHEIPVEYGVVIKRPRLVVHDAAPNRDYNGWYWCVVVDHVTGESVTSPVGTLTVLTAPVITAQPVDLTVDRGGVATFGVEADAGGPVPIRYQWYFGTRPIIGQTKSTITLRNVQPARAGYYSCRIKTVGGTTYSGGAQLIVR